MRNALHNQQYVSPAARMLSRGGVVVVPYRVYIRRLQALYQEGHYRGHGYTLYPGLAYVSAAADKSVEALLGAILTEATDGESLRGLESLTLSCLQTVQLTGNPV